MIRRATEKLGFLVVIPAIVRSREGIKMEFLAL